MTSDAAPAIVDAITIGSARDVSPSKSVAIASYLGKSDTFDRAIATFAEAYADQNQRDFEALQAAAADGRITVESGL